MIDLIARDKTRIVQRVSAALLTSSFLYSLLGESLPMDYHRF